MSPPTARRALALLRNLLLDSTHRPESAGGMETLFSATSERVFAAAGAGEALGHAEPRV